MIFASNHQSHLDTMAILDALPPRWRYRIAPAMLKEFFGAHFHPEQFTLSERLASSADVLPGIELRQRLSAAATRARRARRLAVHGPDGRRGLLILIFPEGKRTDRGEIIHFQPGVGMIASRLGLPVVPVRLAGLDRILHHTWTASKERPRQSRVRRAYLVDGQRLRGIGSAGRSSRETLGGYRLRLLPAPEMWHNL